MSRLLPPPLEVEQTPLGLQTLVPGVAPVTMGDRLAVLANAPLLPRRVQRPADHGLFDVNARNQLELFSPRGASCNS